MKTGREQRTIVSFSFRRHDERWRGPIWRCSHRCERSRATGGCAGTDAAAPRTRLPRKRHPAQLSGWWQPKVRERNTRLLKKPKTILIGDFQNMFRVHSLVHLINMSATCASVPYVWMYRCPKHSCQTVECVAQIFRLLIWSSFWYLYFKVALVCFFLFANQRKWFNVYWILKHRYSFSRECKNYLICSSL